MQYTKESITLALRYDIAEITFIKKDGSTRVMNCTLHAETIIPYESKTGVKKVPNDDVISVWDVDANGWRSIVISTISKFVVEE